jgi:hypothetical protein
VRSNYSPFLQSLSLPKALFLCFYLKQFDMPDNSIALMLDGNPYEVRAVPFTFNEGVRYTVTINGSGEHVFAYDSNVGQYVAIDDDGSTIPQNVETAISGKLLGFSVNT